jgi:hypothetical protein
MAEFEGFRQVRNQGEPGSGVWGADQAAEQGLKGVIIYRLEWVGFYDVFVMVILGCIASSFGQGPEKGKNGLKWVVEYIGWRTMIGWKTGKIWPK